MNRQSSDLSWINEIDNLLEAQSSSIILNNNNFNIDQNEKETDDGGELQRLYDDIEGFKPGIKRSKSNDDDGDDDDDDNDDTDDDDDDDAGISTMNDSSTSLPSKGKGTKEKSKEQREKRKVYCSKLINQARQLSETALNEADKKEESFKELKEKKLYYFNIVLEVLRNICPKNIHKSVSKSTWEPLLDDKFEIAYPRISYFYFKEDMKNDPNRANKIDSIDTSEDFTRIKITTIDDLVRIIFCIDFFLGSLAKLGTNLLDKVTFQPRLTDFILNEKSASANVSYTSTNAFLCGGHKEVNIQGNLIIKFADNKKISSLEFFYNKNECDLVLMESFASVIEKMCLSDNINDMSTVEKPSVFVSSSSLDSDSNSFQLIHGSKISEAAFKEIIEINLLKKQHLSQLCGRDVDKAFTECKPQYFTIEHDHSKNLTNDILLQAVPYYNNPNKENTKLSICRIFEIILTRNFEPNKILWMLYKIKVYDNIMTRLVFLCTNNIVSMYSSWLNNIGNFIGTSFQSKVNSRYHILQELFQMLRNGLDQMETNNTSNNYENVQNFLIIISRIDFLITSEIREDEYRLENNNNENIAEQQQNMDVLLSEEQQFIRSISNEVDKFFTQIRTTKLLDQIVKLLTVVEIENDSNSLQNFINLCWTRHSNAAIQGLQESLRAYVLQKNAHETKLCISEIISIDPNYAEAYSKRAAINFSMNDTTAAMMDIDKAVAIDPYHYGAWCTKGIMEMKLSLFEPAIKSFTIAIDMNPSLQTKSIKVYLDQCILKLQQQKQELTI